MGIFGGRFAGGDEDQGGGFEGGWVVRSAMGGGRGGSGGGGGGGEGGEVSGQW